MQSRARRNIIKAMVIVVLAAVFIAAMVYMRHLAAQVSTDSILDLRFGYAGAEAARYLNSLTAAQQLAYYTFYIFDFLYIAIYGLFYSVTIWALSAHLPSKLRGILLAAPVGAAIFDVIENLVILYALSGDRHGFLAIVGCVTVMKFLLAYGSAIAVVWLLIYLLWRRICCDSA